MLDEMVTVGEVPDWSIENTVISKENSWDMIYKHKKEKGYQDGQLEVCWMTRTTCCILLFKTDPIHFKVVPRLLLLLNHFVWQSEDGWLSRV
jgi:hypothetical protein